MLFTCVRTILGILLVVAAILKLHMLVTDPFADLKLGYPTVLLWAVVFVEFGVGAINIKGSNPLVPFPLIWLVNIVLFGMFFGVSLFRLVMNEASCGCFGKIDIPPVYSCVFSLSIVLLLCVFKLNARNDFKEIVPAGIQLFQNCFSTPTGLGVAVGIFVMFGCVAFPDSRRLLNIGLSRLGAGPVVEGTILRFEPTHHGTVIQGFIRLDNRSDRPIRISGITNSCTCFAVAPTSDVIEKHSSVYVPIVILLSKSGLFEQRVLFFLEHPRQGRVSADVVGTVL
jgi:hypothetical protein